MKLLAFQIFLVVASCMLLQKEQTVDVDNKLPAIIVPESHEAAGALAADNLVAANQVAPDRELAMKKTPCNGHRKLDDGSECTCSGEESSNNESYDDENYGSDDESGTFPVYNAADLLDFFNSAEDSITVDSDTIDSSMFFMCKIKYLVCDGADLRDPDNIPSVCQDLSADPICSQYESSIYSCFGELADDSTFEEERRNIRRRSKRTVKKNHRHRLMRGLNGKNLRPVHQGQSNQLKVNYLRNSKVNNHSQKYRRAVAFGSHFRPNKRNFSRFHLKRNLKHNSGVNHRYLDGTSSADQNYYVGGGATYKTVPNLIVIAEGLSTIYNSIYASVPSESDKGGQDSWDKLANGIQTYAKIRNFAVALLANNDKIVQDLTYVKNNIGSLTMDLEETLAFYDFRDRYNRLKLKSASLTDTFMSKEKELKANADGFTASIRGIASAIDYLLYLNQNLIKQTQFMRERSDPGTPDSIYYIQTVDQTILLIPTLIDTRADAMKALGSIKESLYTIKDTRTKLDANLTDMEKIIDGTYDPSASNKNAGTSSSAIWPSAVLSLLAALVL